MEVSKCAESYGVSFGVCFCGILGVFFFLWKGLMQYINKAYVNDDHKMLESETFLIHVRSLEL